MRKASDLVAVVLPVGHYMGPIVSPGESAWRYAVRLNQTIVDLDPDEFGVWALAHGEPEGDVVKKANRASLESLAAEVALESAPAIVDSLLERGLLARVLPVASAARAFAERHLLFPLGIGMGNTPERPAAFSIGFPPDATRAMVSLGVYDVWAFGARSPSLWQACEAAAVADEESSPGDVLARMLQALPVLVAADTAYLDVA